MITRDSVVLRENALSPVDKLVKWHQKGLPREGEVLNSIIRQPAGSQNTTASHHVCAHFTDRELAVLLCGAVDAELNPEAETALLNKLFNR